MKINPETNIKVRGSGRLTVRQLDYSAKGPDSIPGVPQVDVTWAEDQKIGIVDTSLLS